MTCPLHQRDRKGVVCRGVSARDTKVLDHAVDVCPALLWASFLFFPHLISTSDIDIGSRNERCSMDTDGLTASRDFDQMNGSGACMYQGALHAQAEITALLIFLASRNTSTKCVWTD